MEKFDFKNASKKELKQKYNEIARKIGDDQFFTKKELHYLPEILQNGEQVLAFTSGLMEGNTWLITLTDRRIIFLDKGMLWGLEQTVIDLDKINSVSGKTGIFFGDIYIQDGASERKIENVWKKTVKNCHQYSTRSDRGKKISISAAFTYRQLQKKRVFMINWQKLSQLQEKNIISEEEFTLEKEKLLGSQKSVKNPVSKLHREEPAKTILHLASNAQRKAKMTVIDRRFSDIYLNLNEEKVLGRSNQASIYIDNQYVSAKHLSVFLSANNVLTIKDLNSSNGTYMNGQKLQVSAII